MKSSKAAKVCTKCYDNEREWPSRQAAIDFFTEGMWSCDPNSSEHERYATIVAKLESGADYATDEYWETE